MRTCELFGDAHSFRDDIMTSLGLRENADWTLTSGKRRDTSSNRSLAVAVMSDGNWWRDNDNERFGKILSWILRDTWRSNTPAFWDMGCRLLYITHLSQILPESPPYRTQPCIAAFCLCAMVGLGVTEEPSTDQRHPSHLRPTLSDLFYWDMHTLKPYSKAVGFSSKRSD